MGSGKSAETGAVSFAFAPIRGSRSKRTPVPRKNFLDNGDRVRADQEI